MPLRESMPITTTATNRTSTSRRCSTSRANRGSRRNGCSTICNEFYGTEEIHGYGYGQDEDQGQLGAWYVMASMGLFDAKGLTAPDPTFQIGSPLFDKVTIRLNPDYYTGKEFVIETTGNTPENYYIGSLELDGKPLQSVQLPFAEVVGGGTLRVNLAAEPNTRLNQITTKNIPSWHNRHIIATPWAWTSAAAMSARRW